MKKQPHSASPIFVLSITQNSPRQRDQMMPSSPRVFIGVKRAHAVSLHRLPGPLLFIRLFLGSRIASTASRRTSTLRQTIFFESLDQVTVFYMNTGSFSRGNENLCQPQKKSAKHTQRAPGADKTALSIKAA